MEGGDLFKDIADLAIPFGFLVGAKGLQLLTKKKTQQHGGEACFLCMQEQEGAARKYRIQQDLIEITDNLKKLVATF
jgi:hypothetical protein